MKLIVPEEVGVALAAAEEARAKAQQARERTALAEKARLMAIQQRREEGERELNEHARAVFRWVGAFALTPEAQQVRSFIGEEGRVELFGARFWRGEPVPAGDISSWAVTSFTIPDASRDQTPRLWYVERYRSRDQTPHPIRHPVQLVETVHPDYLVALRAHLEGPEAWSYILQDLRRLSVR